MTEHIHTGYKPVKIGHLVSCQCACGGWITVNPDTAVNRFNAVQRHQSTAQHRAWSVPLFGP